MYCGNNRTARSSQRQISEAMRRLMLHKTYASISVSELCKEAGISRPTFYSLFRSTENVILYLLQEDCCELPRETQSGTSLELLCHIYSNYICHNREFLKLLVENDIGYLLYNSVYDSFLHCGCCLQTVPEQERQYAAHFLAGGITGVVRQYCITDPPPSVESLSTLLWNLFSGQMFSL